MAATLLMNSCEELEKTTAYDKSQIVSPVLTSTSPIVITEDNYSTGSTTFSWQQADFGYPAQISYAIYASYGETKDFCLYANIYQNSYKVTNEELYGKLTGVSYLGMPTGESQATVYVTATIGSNYEVVSSTPANISFNLAELASAPVLLYFPGSYNGWNMYANGIWGVQGLYKGYVDMNSTSSPLEFKFLTSKGEWLGNSLDDIGDGANLSIDAGFYYATVDLNEHKATMVPMDIVGLTGINGAWGTPAVALEYDYAEKCYKKTIEVEYADNKFRILCHSPLDAGGWFWSYTIGAASADDINLVNGSTVKLLPPGESGVSDDGNMYMREAGTFEFKFYYNATDSYYYLHVTKK